MVCNKFDIAFDIKQTLYILNSIQQFTTGYDYIGS